jgi:hypothetical protein
LAPLLEELALLDVDFAEMALQKGKLVGFQRSQEPVAVFLHG